MDRDSEVLFAVKPATFHYKKDPSGTRSFGLIAEEVAQVSPDLITWDEHGRPQTVRYEAVNAMLLNEFLKEHGKVQELEKGMAALTAQLKGQATQINKVSARVGMNKPATRMVSR